MAKRRSWPWLGSASALLVSLRPSHWAKNLFIFLPLVFGGQLGHAEADRRVVWGFWIFSLLSSSAYLLNDVVDRAADRRHPKKRFRPIAAGRLDVRVAVVSACGLTAAALGLAFPLDPAFGWTAVAYLALNLAYSLGVKHWVILDVACLGGFFVMRIVAGAVLARVVPSHWIILLTFLLALFLGFTKRRQEIAWLKGERSRTGVLAEYDPYFIDQVSSVLTASIAIVYLLYTVDRDTVERVGSVHLLLSAPCVYYGVFRYLYVIHRIKVARDPTSIFWLDRPLQIDLALWIAVCVAVIYGRV